MQNSENIVFRNIQKYKRKYYLNLLLRGLIWSAAVLLSVFLIVTFAEYFAYFNKTVRAVLFFSFVFIAAVVLFIWVASPLFKLMNLERSFPDELAATRIGSSFPHIQDKLLNLLQLQKNSDRENQLLMASIRQKSAEIEPVSFDTAIDFSTNTRYLRYLIPSVLLLLAGWFLIPGLFTDSTKRIVQYRQDFTPAAPFNFVLQNNNLQAFKNEDYTLQLQFNGETKPATAYIWLNGRRVKMQQQAGLFSYTFSKIQESKNFRFEAAGYDSKDYELNVVERPFLQNFQVELNYPSYLQKKNERLSNIGNFQVPEGTQINWQFKTLNTDSLRIAFPGSGEDTVLNSASGKTPLLSFLKQAKNSQDYEISLYNQWSENKDPIRYHLEVIKDEYPAISLNPYADTTLYNFIVLGGNVSDDYGLSRLQIFYRINRAEKGETEDYKSIRLPLQANQTSQSYYYRWNLDSLNVRRGDQLEYFVKVWDNDGVNGFKPAQSGMHTLKLPDTKELKEAVSKAERNAESGINKSVKQAKSLEQKIKKAEERLKGKNNVNYQDEKQLQEILEERKKLEEQLQELKKETEAIKEQKERFSEKQNEKIKEQSEELQKLMDELLDEETKRLYEELEKLMEEKRQSEDFQKVLKDLGNKEKNLEKELARALEMFKRMKFDSKLDEAIKELEEQALKQEKLSEETGNNKEQEKEDLLQQQQELNEEFKEMEKSMEELNKLNQDLKNPNAMDDFNEEQQEIEKQQQESRESLEKGKKKQAQKSQKKASDQMKQMAKKMQEMQGGMEMEMMQENLDHLRDIVDNLITLSFSQEELMKEFRQINQSNPRFVNLSQEQLKIKDDAVILEDSLRSLAERVFQIRSFVTREVNDMNKYLDESVNAIKERKKGEATGKQQFAMTSMNNLALLLDDVLQQMQQQMADAMGMPQKGKKNKDGDGAPNLSQLQKQLNERISQLKKSGKTGKELSEELARMAAEQEQIREALKNSEEKFGKGKEGKQSGKDGLQEQMEETESDLVNKKITRELLERQQQILTRLLETEKAMREREQDEERKGETAKDYEKRLPEAFEEYLKLKEKEIELLKSVPPKLNPYYKKEVNNYFKRLGL